MPDHHRCVVSLPCQPDAPAEARQFVRQCLSDSLSRDRVELLVSELVTNAVLHARSAVEVTVDAGKCRTRVEVGDSSQEEPVKRTTHLDGGYGLRFLDTIATDWGVEVHHHGKTVWFEVANTDPPTA